MKFIFQGSQKKHVRVAISQKGLYEMSQDAPHLEAVWTPDWMALSEFTEVKVTLEVNCGRSVVNLRVKVNKFLSWDMSFQQFTTI